MSLLWRDGMRIGLAPDRLVCSLYGRGLRRTVPGREIIAVETDSTADWRPAVEALPSALALARGRRVAVTVVLSNHFVRYAVLPWIPGLKTEEEWLNLAHHRLALVHGQSAAEWTVRVSETSPQGPRLACAVDRSLLEALESRIADAGATLASVQPYLMAAFNRIRPDLGNEPCWLALEEPGRLTLALIQNGAWAAIRSRRSDERWAALLPETLERESAVMALEQPCAQVIVYSAQEAFNVDVDGAFRLRNLTCAPGGAPEDCRFAMVLA